MSSDMVLVYISEANNEGEERYNSKVSIHNIESVIYVARKQRNSMYSGINEIDVNSGDVLIKVVIDRMETFAGVRQKSAIGPSDLADVLLILTTSWRKESTLLRMKL